MNYTYNVTGDYEYVNRFYKDFLSNFTYYYKKPNSFSKILIIYFYFITLRTHNDAKRMKTFLFDI